jgi:hypothetical protein
LLSADDAWPLRGEQTIPEAVDTTDCAALAELEDKQQSQVQEASGTCLDLRIVNNENHEPAAEDDEMFDETGAADARKPTHERATSTDCLPGRSLLAVARPVTPKPTPARTTHNDLPSSRNARTNKEVVLRSLLIGVPECS